MFSGENRRTFLSALLLAGGSAAAFAESIRQGDGPAPDGPGDALFLHIQQQLASATQSGRIRGSGPTAEEAAAAAACMRICATHARGLNLDGIARDGLARLSSTGRNALARGPVDLAGVRQRLRQKGLVFSDRVGRDVAMIGKAARTAAIETIQQGRATSICDGLAEALDAAASHLAEQRGPIRRAVAADAWWCNFYVAQWSMYLALAWSLAVLEDQSLQDFIDALWAGFVFYEGLYTNEC